MCFPVCSMPRGGDGRHLGRQPWRWLPWGESPGPILLAAPDLLLHTYPCSLGRKMSPGRPELLHGRWETRDQCLPSSPEVPSQPTFLFPPSRFLQFVCCTVFLGGGVGVILSMDEQGERRLPYLPLPPSCYVDPSNLASLGLGGAISRF